MSARQATDTVLDGIAVQSHYHGHQGIGTGHGNEETIEETAMGPPPGEAVAGGDMGEPRTGILQQPTQRRSYFCL